MIAKVRPHTFSSIGAGRVGEGQKIAGYVRCFTHIFRELQDIGHRHSVMAKPEFTRETTMAKCPFAVWTPFDGSPGGYAGGHPFKIVHHTTEGSSADGAFAAYRDTKNVPHFTVDDMTVYQHVDTGEAASALKHPT